MRNVEEAGLTDFENQVKQAKIASCHLVNVEAAIDSFLLE